MLTRIFSFIGITLLLFMSGCIDSSDVWVQGEGFRYQELDMKGRSRIGFTEITPQRSGITVENLVSLDAIIENRHMMHGSGIAIGDVTGDGMPDIYVAQLAASDALYRNLGDWKFQDISAQSGLDTTAHATSGVTMVDLDGDHDLDLLLTMPLGPGAVYHNLGTGNFERVPDGSGLYSPFAGTTATLADVDQDGDLDVYIARYKRVALADSLPPEAITWEAVLRSDELQPKEEFLTHYRMTRVGRRVIRSELAEPDGLYLNDGRGVFSEVSWTGGAFLDETGNPLELIPRDWALTAKFHDITGDGIIDLYVCNDFDSPDELWIGLGDGRFQRAPRHALRKTSNATMSVDFSDVNQDGIVDFFTTDMLSRDYSLRLRQRNTRIPIESPLGDDSFRPQEMQNTLMVGRGDTTFAELAWYSGVAASDWSWATSFVDVDLDGWEDLLITTGHLFDVQDLDAQLNEQHRMAAASTWKAARRLLLEFPPLKQNNVAFRNRTDLTFEDISDMWGFGQTADIAHGMALGDLDGDGDLDLVTNRLNASPGVYRNNAGAQRLAVMLEGNPPNTSAVGASIGVQCPGLPAQTKQISAGGSYLSSNQFMAVFAVNHHVCQIEVIWPLGSHSRIEVDGGNRLYIIEEPIGVDRFNYPEEPSRELLYQLDHQFEPLIEHEYDDFASQPLLPWRLSRQGPALAAVDIHQDGRFELIQGGGSHHMVRLNGKPILDSLKGDAAGIVAVPIENNLTRLIIGESHYEGFIDSSRIHIYDLSHDASKIHHQILPFGPGAPGPLSLVDMDLDGDLDLFVGGQFIPGEYPRSVDSRIYLYHENSYKPSAEFSESLRQLGLVNGSVSGDLDGDGYSDLVVATEWGPVRVFKGAANGFIDQTESLGLADYKGWWRGVALGDFNGDGALDIVASNVGWNHRYGRRVQVHLHYGDFNTNGRINMMQSFYDPVEGIDRPSRMLSDLVQIISPLQMGIRSHKEFSTADVSELLPQQWRSSSRMVNANEYATSIFLNFGDRFEHRPLHPKAQYSVGIAPVVLDANLDGNEDILLSQNWFAYPLSTPRQDAGRALLLLGNGDGTFSPEDNSGFKVYGEGRAVSVGDFTGDHQEEIAFAQHNGPTLVYRKLSGLNDGIYIQFDRPSDAIGAVMRVVYSDGRLGPARIITAGSGYWSQHATSTTLGLRDTSPTAIEITWPGMEPVYVTLEGESHVLSLSK